MSTKTITLQGDRGRRQNPSSHQTNNYIYVWREEEEVYVWGGREQQQHQWQQPQEQTQERKRESPVGPACTRRPEEKQEKKTNNDNNNNNNNSNNNNNNNNNKSESLCLSINTHTSQQNAKKEASKNAIEYSQFVAPALAVCTVHPQYSFFPFSFSPSFPPSLPPTCCWISTRHETSYTPDPNQTTTASPAPP